jgi:phospholipid-binding lipoprotein MlaA
MRKRYWLLLSGVILLISCLYTPAFPGDYSSVSAFQLNGDFELVLPQDNKRIADANFTMSRHQRNDNISRYVIYAQSGDEQEENFEEEEDLDYLEEEEDDVIADPLEPVNRVFFKVNDKLYFWLLKPVTQAYSFLLPEPVRRSVTNIFNNVSTPIRFVNNLLQFKLKSAGTELLRFGINTTVGVLGVFDVARNNESFQMQDEDLGQTLGTWGLGPGFYINWPVLGPSSLRDTVGSAGDYFLDPINYVSPDVARYSINAGKTVNKTSFRIGDYEEIKKDALDPYSAVRDIYHQYRKSKIER